MSAPDPGPLPSLAPLTLIIIATVVFPLVAALTYGSRAVIVTSLVVFAVTMWVQRQWQKRMDDWHRRAAAFIRSEVDACRLHPAALQMAEQFEKFAERRK